MTTQSLTRQRMHGCILRVNDRISEFKVYPAPYLDRQENEFAKNWTSAT